MTKIDYLVRFARNNMWSNFRLLRECLKLSPEEWSDTKRTSFFPSLPETLNHILIVDWFYIDGLMSEGRGPQCFEKDIPFPNAKDLEKAQREADAKLLRYVESLTDEQLSSKVQFDRVTRIQVETVEDTLMHLFQHQIHHRGQAHAMLSGTSVKPPQLDEFFMRDDVGLREAELRALGLPIE